MKLSVVITVYNEEKMLPDCLRSIKDFADEIVVVDCESTDKTAEIAKKFTSKIYQQKNDPSAIDIQKNFGFTKATGDWILSLDADERITSELAQEIKKIIENSEVAGYWIPRKNIIFGKWIQHTGWYPDEQLRLFRQGKGKYKAIHVHEDLIVDGEVGHVYSYMLHEHYQTIAQFIQRGFLIYAPNEARSRLEKGYTFSAIDIIRFPMGEFLSRYFAREGYKDGLHGLALSLLMASYHLMVFCYIWQEKKFPEEKELFILKDVYNEGKKMRTDFAYWITHEGIKNEKNVLKKILLKAKRKIS